MLTLDARFEGQNRSRDRFTGLSASTFVLSVKINHVTDARPTNERVGVNGRQAEKHGKTKPSLAFPLDAESHVDRSRDRF